MDIEFTIQQGTLVHAAVPRRKAHRLRRGRASPSTWCEEQLIAPKRGAAARRARAAEPAAAARRSTPPTRSAPCSEQRLLAKGLNAGPGAAAGAIVFHAEDAEAAAARGERGHPGAHRDVAGGHPRHGRGARHPHRARRHDQPRRAWSRARWARCASPAASALEIDYAARTMRVAGRDRRCARATISRSTASTGEVFRGAHRHRAERGGARADRPHARRRGRRRSIQRYAQLMSWADKARTLGVRANADQPDQAHARDRLRRRGHRALPHRAHVLRRGQDRRRCAR